MKTAKRISNAHLMVLLLLPRVRTEDMTPVYQEKLIAQAEEFLKREQTRFQVELRKEEDLVAGTGHQVNMTEVLMQLLPDLARELGLPDTEPALYRSQS